MNILMIAPYAPYPPNSGGRIRMWEQIHYLGQRHELTVVFFVSTPQEYEQRDLLAGCCQRAIAILQPDLPTSPDIVPQPKQPLILNLYSTMTMRKTLNALQADNFDIVIIEHIFMAQYHDLFPEIAILQEQNIESEIVRQQAIVPSPSAETARDRKRRVFNKATWLHLKEYENQTWPKFPLRIVVSEHDQQEIDRHCYGGRTIVIENGVNIQRFAPLNLPPHSHKVLFMGTLNYQPNVDAILYMKEHIFPTIWQHNPFVHFLLAGRDPLPEVYDAVASDPRIELIANPENMRTVAQQCSLTVVPLRIGGGTRIKILYAMAMGLPVVSTSLGCEGLHVTDGEHLLIRDDPAQFAEAVLRLLADPALRATLRRNGRRLVEERYDWQQKFAQMERELLDFVGNYRD